VIAILFAATAFVVPGITLAVLLGLFAAYMAIDGVVAIVAAVRAIREHSSFWPLLLEGVAGLAAAAIAVVWPALTLLALIYLAGAWAIVSGILLIVGAARLHRVVHGRWLLILSGVLSAVWGVLLYLWPIAGLVVLTWWIGAYALLFGIMLVTMGVRLRRMLPPGATHAHA
jgi:uncharacterized membrane protein HdeD (DUF308 family)